MGRPKRTQRFAAEVHLGLLVIIFILLLLDFASNYIISIARTDKRECTTMALNNAAESMARTIQREDLSAFTPQHLESFKKQFELSAIVLVPSKPDDTRPATRHRWFAEVARGFPPGQIPNLAQKLLTSDYQSLTRGENEEYFYVYPVAFPTGDKLIVLSTNAPDLAYLEDSSKLVLVIGVVSVFSIVGLYLLLFRFILSPFEKIKEQALGAGRIVVEGPDEVEALVDEYRKIIDELQQKEAELIALNSSIQRKAESLEQFNEYLLTSMSSGVVTLDRNYRLLSLNDASQRILGVDASGHQGERYTELFGNNRQLVESIEDALESDKHQPYREYDLTVRGGETVHLGITISVIHDNAPNKIGLSILINDLTQIRRLRAELEVKNRLVALGEMASGLAHQLRNSIGAILGYSNLVRKRLTKSNLELDSLAALEKETREAESLVDRFLHFARPFDFHPAPADLSSILGEIIRNFQLQGEYQAVEFRLHDGLPPGVRVIMDALLVKQALTNLIENAFNAYGGGKGQIDIHLSSMVDAVEVRITDYGCGIPKANMDKIFTPFFSSRPSGTGLGLPLARKIIDLHDGRLSVVSEPGRGATFTVVLPLAGKAVDSVVPAIPSI